MLNSLFLGTLLLAVPNPTTVPSVDGVLAIQQDDKKALKVLGQWLAIYKKGKFELGKSTTARGRDPWTFERQLLVVKSGLLTKEQLEAMTGGGGRGGMGRGRGGGRGGRGMGRRAFTYINEITWLTDKAVGIGGPDAAKVLLRTAAIGLDRKVTYTPEMLPNIVRNLGEKALARLEGEEVRQYLTDAANGKVKAVMQAAALRVLSYSGDDGHAPLLTKNLGASSEVVRIACAEGLARLQVPHTMTAIAEQLEKEKHPSVIIVLLEAAEKIKFGKNGGRVKDEHVRWVTVQAARAIGRTDSWPTDIAIVNFLEKFRSRASIPYLIGVLERFGSDNKLLKSGKVSGRLRLRAHEVLISLTGTHIRIDAPQKWREFWQREKNNLKIVPEKPKGGSKSSGNTVTPSKFFNIPIRGTRVVFVIDQSGSMQWPRTGGRRGTSSGGRGGRTTKIAIAKRELRSAVMALPAQNKFNVVCYNDRIDSWKKKLVPASEANKKQFLKWLDKLRANGATNIFDAMQQGLKIKSLVYGDRYDSNVDEVFLLSDGAPTAGAVQNPIEIARLIKQTNKFSGVRINTVYIGGGMQGGGGGPRPGGPGGRPRGPGGGRGGPGGGMDQGRALMKRLAEENGGKFVEPPR